VENRFSVLHQLTDLEQQLIDDARRGWNQLLAIGGAPQSAVAV
jgi:hypothetical protein